MKLEKQACMLALAAILLLIVGAFVVGFPAGATLAEETDIAEATEESHKISILRANGLLDADICAARMNAISARLAQLRGERRRLTENEAIDETMDALRKVEQTFLNGPERLDGFDEELFEHLVEKIIAESQNRIRFRLYGGLELTEQWEVAAR